MESCNNPRVHPVSVARHLCVLLRYLPSLSLIIPQQANLGMTTVTTMSQHSMMGVGEETSVESFGSLHVSTGH